LPHVGRVVTRSNEMVHHMRRSQSKQRYTLPGLPNNTMASYGTPAWQLLCMLRLLPSELVPWTWMTMFSAFVQRCTRWTRQYLRRTTAQQLPIAPLGFRATVAARLGFHRGAPGLNTSSILLPEDLNRHGQPSRSSVVLLLRLNCRHSWRATKLPEPLFSTLKRPKI
jgi:hypothetical protein